ncbi:hypothetical protein GOBAR_AA37602 [Gossypium barbadense]|uniref:Uncharacterized protein n=1 Tax=Gossypium barbadense TaxID=3634 RepID=A0A2P5VW95_GOSBA|nr:hypothetical protein GOBAR_AA37602 [Gossypium barbadense]
MTPLVTPSSSKDPLELLQGPITRARAKQFKETISALINQVWGATTYMNSLNEGVLMVQLFQASLCGV